MKWVSIPRKEGELIKEGPNIQPFFKGEIDKLIFKEDYIRHYIDKEGGLFIILPRGESLFETLKDYFCKI